MGKGDKFFDTLRVSMFIPYGKFYNNFINTDACKKVSQNKIIIMTATS